jgi:hypothetical protein
LQDQPAKRNGYPDDHRTGVKVAMPSIKLMSNAAPPKAHACPATTSLRLRWIDDAGPLAREQAHGL